MNTVLEKETARQKIKNSFKLLQIIPMRLELELVFRYHLNANNPRSYNLKHDEFKLWLEDNNKLKDHQPTAPRHDQYRHFLIDLVRYKTKRTNDILLEYLLETYFEL